MIKISSATRRVR